MFANLFTDFRYALRGLAARPGFTAVVVLSMAFGVGLNAAIFSLYEQITIRPLAVHEATDLVILSSPGPRQVTNLTRDVTGPREQVFSYPMFRDLETDAGLRSAFAGLAGHRSLRTNIAYRGRTLSASGVLVSADYFAALRLRPALGRLLHAIDDRSDSSPVVVLSHRYWRDQLGSDPAVLDGTLLVNGLPLTIVGVAPAGFDGISRDIEPQFFAPLSLAWALQPSRPDDRADRTSYWVYLFARLAPGVAPDHAGVQISARYRTLLREFELPLQSELSEGDKTRFLDRGIDLLPGSRGQSMVSGQLETPLMWLLAVTSLLLLVACANIAGVILARNIVRTGEFAVRASIGADRSRLLRLALVESGLLAVLGAALALMLVGATGRLFASVSALAAGTMVTPQANLYVLGLVGAVTLLCVFLFGALPAWRLSRVAPLAALRAGGEVGEASSLVKVRSVLAVAQIAVSTAALVMAILFGQSLMKLASVETGLAVESVAGFSISPELSGYSPERSARLFEQIERELAVLPGVDSAAGSVIPLLAGAAWGTTISVEGFASDREPDHTSVNSVGPDFHETLGIPLLAGRTFEAVDAADRPKVAIVNRRFAEHYGLLPDPVGKRMAVDDRGALDIEIVGVVEDSAYDGIKGDKPIQFYRPWRQEPWLGAMTFYVRTSLDPEAILPQLAATVARIDPDLPVESLRTLPAQARIGLSSERALSFAAAGFAVLATGLAALGVYGALNLNLSRRRREVALRLALGASPTQVRTLLLGQLFRLGVFGAVIGSICALALGRFAEALLFGVSGHEPTALLLAVLVVVVVALLSAWSPLRRSSRIDPMQALRHE